MIEFKALGEQIIQSKKEEIEKLLNMQVSYINYDYDKPSFTVRELQEYGDAKKRTLSTIVKLKTKGIKFETANGISQELHKINEYTANRVNWLFRDILAVKRTINVVNKHASGTHGNNNE